MCQLRNLLKRRNVTNDVTKDMYVNEDFLNLVVSTYNSSSNECAEQSLSDFPSGLSGMHSDATAALNSPVCSIHNKFIYIPFSKDRP